MFTNIFFIIIVLLLITTSSEGISEGVLPSHIALVIAMLIYVAVLGVIIFQNVVLGRKLYRYKDAALKVANTELILFLAAYYFILGGDSVFQEHTPFLNSLFSLALYFGGLAVFHCSVYQILKINYAKSMWNYVGLQLRILIPFVIPFLLFMLLIDFSELFAISPLVDEGFGSYSIIITLLIITLFLTLLFFFMPLLIQIVWKCQPLQNRTLKERLENLCRRANFKHAGMTTWSVLDHSLTAGIIGIVPRFRYVMFSKRLTEELPYDQIEAILAHEIGHSSRKHLLIYPFIIGGMMIVGGLFSLLLSETTDSFFELAGLMWPGILWDAAYLFAAFFSYVLIMALYFRFVFGFYSRLLEREADLHIFALNIPPEQLIDAFHSVGRSTGTYDIPNWHHFSIKERVDFITMAMHNPELIGEHHRKVKKHLLIFFTLLFLMTTVLISPLASAHPPFRQIANMIESVGHHISNAINGGMQRSLAEKNGSE